MPLDSDAPRPLGRQDAAALVGLLAVLGGHLLAGNLDRHLIEHLTGRLRSDGLLGPGAGPAELRLALDDLNHRLRYVLGEYDEPPAPDTGQVDLQIGFAAEESAHAFVEAVSAQGWAAVEPVPVDGRSYDDGTVRWEVAVRSATPPLSAEFDLERRRLLALASKGDGRDGGWGSPPP